MTKFYRMLSLCIMIISSSVNNLLTTKKATSIILKSKKRKAHILIAKKEKLSIMKDREKQDLLRAFHNLKPNILEKESSEKFLQLMKNEKINIYSHKNPDYLYFKKKGKKSKTELGKKIMLFIPDLSNPKRQILSSIMLQNTNGSHLNLLIKEEPILIKCSTLRKNFVELDKIVAQFNENYNLPCNLYLENNGKFWEPILKIQKTNQEFSLKKDQVNDNLKNLVDNYENPIFILQEDKINSPIQYPVLKQKMKVNGKKSIFFPISFSLFILGGATQAISLISKSGTNKKVVINKKKINDIPTKQEDTGIILPTEEVVIQPLNAGIVGYL